MKNTLKKHAGSAKNKVNVVQKKSRSFIQKYPVASFLIILLLLFTLIATGSFFRTNEDTVNAQATPKQVYVHRVGESASFTTNAKLEKSNLVTIVAQAPGIVSQIYTNTGDSVTRGQTILSLSTNYQGGNAAGIQTQIAKTQKQLFDDTYQLNLDIINRQIDAANQNFDNSDQLRSITEDSISASQDLLDLNQDILDSINQNLEDLENASDSASNQDLILATKQLKSQYQSIVNQLDTTINNQEYSTDTDNPPQQLSESQRDIALKQLEVQKKSLSLNGEITNLQLQLAQVNQALMMPASPFSGIVQQVLVKVGENVNPGTPIAIVSGNEQSITAIAYVSKTIAKNVNQLQPSTLQLGSNQYQTKPFFVSTEAVAGNQYAVFYSLPEEFSTSFTNNSFVSVSIPVGYMDTTSSATFIPLDAVYQTAGSDYIFIVSQDNTAQAQEVSLGQIFGNQVQVQSGLDTGTQVIVDRSVITSDPVQVIN